MFFNDMEIQMIYCGCSPALTYTLSNVAVFPRESKDLIRQQRSCCRVYISSEFPTHDGDTGHTDVNH